MAYDSKAVANWLLDKFTADKQECTQLQLNKLVFIAHGWCLGVLKTPLIDEVVVAWKFGPVIPSLRDEFREFGSRPITCKAKDWIDDDKYNVPELTATSEELQVLKWVWDKYGSLDAGKLINITHRKGSPWAEVTQNGTEIGNNKEINNEIIKNYYSSLLAHS